MEVPDLATKFGLQGQFTVLKKIGSGSGGEVYSGTKCDTGEAVALKMEPYMTRSPSILYESKLYRILCGGSENGIAKCHWYGWGEGYNIMAIDLLGPSIEDLWEFCGGRLSLKTTLMLADQMITRIEYIHSKSFAHRSIKASNFVMGTGADANVVYIIDFGKVARYRDATTLAHIPYRENVRHAYSTSTASINTHRGVCRTRRDDIEGLAYTLIRLLKGKLPWEGGGLFSRSRSQEVERVRRLKESCPIETLCKNIPQEFGSFLTYARGLKFAEEPDYDHMRAMFRGVMEREGFQYDNVFDWTPKPEPEPESPPSSPPASASAPASELDPRPDLGLAGLEL